MRATTAAQQLVAPGPDLLSADLDPPAWAAFTSSAAAATPAEPPRRLLSLARQPTPLLPCGLTADELAALTAAQAASGNSMADAESSSEQSSSSRRSFERVNRVASATAAARQARRRSPGPAALPLLPALNWQQGRRPPARQRSISEGRLPDLDPVTPRGSAETITAAQRLAAISPGPLSSGGNSAAGLPSVLLDSGSMAPGWQQNLAWAPATPGSPRAVRSSAPARPANWQREVAALEALTGTQSPRAAARGDSEFTAEGPEWLPGSPRASLGHTPDPELQTPRKPRPSRLSAVSGSSAAAPAPEPTPASSSGGSSAGSSMGQEDSTPLQPRSAGGAAEALPEAAEAAAAEAAISETTATAGEEEDQAPFPEDPGMSSFSSQASATAAAAAEPPRAGSPGGPAEQAASGQQPQAPLAIATAAQQRPCFPVDPGQGKSAAPHALRQLSPTAASAAAAGSDAGSPPTTPAPSTPRKKRGGLFSALNRILRF